MATGNSRFGLAFAYPALKGETSREGQDHQSQLDNVATVQRMFVNAGFVVGPIAGGFLGHVFGIQRAFAVLGAVMLVCFIPIIGILVHFHSHGRTHKSLLAAFDL